MLRTVGHLAPHEMSVSSTQSTLRGPLSPRGCGMCGSWNVMWRQVSGNCSRSMRYYAACGHWPSVRNTPHRHRHPGWRVSRPLTRTAGDAAARSHAAENARARCIASSACGWYMLAAQCCGLCSPMWQCHLLSLVGRCVRVLHPYRAGTAVGGRCRCATRHRSSMRCSRKQVPAVPSRQAWPVAVRGKPSAGQRLLHGALLRLTARSGPPSGW